MVDRVLKERYAIQQRLGKNAGRQTWLARDLQTEELVAIKILTFGLDFQWDDLKLFEREAETLQSLSHPAIPRYLDYFEFQTRKTKRFALVQSYIEAKSLAEWVELGRTFNEEEIKQLTQALLKILIYLHRQHPSVIHRDIKPSNILLGERSPQPPLSRGAREDRVYLVDFGSVQTLAAREGSTVTVVGTYGYMPPEQFGGRAIPASDLYGLGATLIYLVTGVHPAELPQEDLRIKFEPKIDLSSDFVDWLKWMTEPDLNSRLTSADRALKALEKPREGRQSVVQKYPGSKVQIKRNRDYLEIFIPEGKAEPWVLLLWIILIFFPGLTHFFSGGIILTVLLFATPFPGNLFMGFLGILLLTLFGLIVMGFIKSFSRSTQLRIDQRQISLNKLPPSPRRTICKLEFIRGDYSRDSSFPRNIQIWAGTREYKLLVSHLTDGEIDWIANELSEWLNLPIS